jgi:Type IV secretion system pilin
MLARRLALMTAVAALVLLAVPASALAASSLNQVIDNLRVWLTGLLAALATAALMVGAVRYLWSGHDPGQLERAKGSFKAALAGYALALLAPVFVSIVRQIVG